MIDRVIHALPITSLCLVCSSVLADAEAGSWLEVYGATTGCEVQLLGLTQVQPDGYALVLGKYRIRSQGMSQAQLNGEIEAALSGELRRWLRSVHVQIYKDSEALERGEPLGPVVIPVCTPPHEIPGHRDGHNKRLAHPVPPNKALQQTLDPVTSLAVAKEAPASSAAELGS